MISDSKKHQIEILGQNYTIISDETDSDIEKIVYMVNSFLKEIISKSPQIDHTKAIVFVALKLANNTIKLENLISNYEEYNTKIIGRIEQELY